VSSAGEIYYLSDCAGYKKLMELEGLYLAPDKVRLNYFSWFHNFFVFLLLKRITAAIDL